MAMEDDARKFLVLIMQMVSSIILWLLINIFFGIYLQYGMFNQSPSLSNIIYYSLFIIGSYFIFRYFKKRWNGIDLS